MATTTDRGRPPGARAQNADRRDGRRTSAAGGSDVFVLTAALAGLLGYAWINRNEGHLTAESGAGYLLGIAGSLMMLLLLVYPLRKRVRRLHAVGSVPAWFRIHMLLGILGPSLILLHSNFALGSLNSRVALFAMLVVAGSGYVGRFFYLRIHRGLGGQKRVLADLTQEVASDVSELKAVGLDPALFVAYQKRLLPEGGGLVRALGIVISQPFARAGLKRQALAAIGRGKGLRETERAREHIDRFLRAMARAEGFLLYERLFALWHMAHLPLFLILILAACLHVVAVHLY